MKRFVIACGIFGLLAMVSCEKCMQCSYTYTTTTIQQTVNGEQEVITTHESWIIDTGDLYLKEECIKKDESFTIEARYQLFADTTTLDDFEYTCVEI